MKKIFLFLLPLFVFTGCSLQSVKQQVDSGLARVMQKDQSSEQGFAVDRDYLYAHYLTADQYLDLAKQSLTTIPDICALMDASDTAAIQRLSLAQNAIRIVDQDLSCMTNLRFLNLSYNEITQVVRLGTLPTLQELFLHKNKIETIATLPDLPGLQTLNLGYNTIKEATGLEKYSNLKILELHHNALEKIIGVEKLQKLEELKLEFNKLKELPFLDSLKQLKSITTEGNSLEEIVANKAKELQAKYMQELLNTAKKMQVK